MLARTDRFIKNTRYDPPLIALLSIRHIWDARKQRMAGNRVASLIELEGSPAPEVMREVVSRLRKRLRGPQHDSLRRAFTVWLSCKNTWRGNRRFPRPMVWRRLKPCWPLPEWAVSQLEAASLDQLQNWAEAIFDAPSLEALLGEGK